MIFMHLTVLSQFLFAGQNIKSKTIDLGDLEIQGEVRRPMMDSLESDLRMNELFRTKALEQMKAHEARLLK